MRGTLLAVLWGVYTKGLNTENMGNAQQVAAVESAGHNETSLNKRHCVMQRKLLSGELTQLLAEARGQSPGATIGRSKRMLLERIKQLKGQIDQLERVEMSFDRISNIKQTAGMVQQVKNLLDNSGDLPSADGILDLEDSIVDSQDVLGEIENALAQSWQQGGDISQGDLNAELDGLFGGEGRGPGNQGQSSGTLLLPSVPASLSSERPASESIPIPISQSSQQQISAVQE